MSSFVYGFVTAKRVVAAPGTSKTTAAPGMTTYIDTLSALVPAEALALYAGVVAPNTTRTLSAGGKAATVVSDPKLLGWSCAGLLVLSAALYIIGRYSVTKMRNKWDVLRTLIPPAAFAAWMLVQNPGVFDVWWPGSSTSVRVVIAAFAAVVLGILAKILGYQADQAQPAHTQVDRAQPAQAPAGQEQPGGPPAGRGPGDHAPGEQGAGAPAPGGPATDAAGGPATDGPAADGSDTDGSGTGEAGANGSATGR